MRAPASTRVAARAAFAALFTGVLAAAQASCASAAPFNPEHLGSAQLQRVEGVCQSVMGLSPSEPLSLVWGAATNPGVAGGENHYQGCVAALSVSLAGVNDGEAAWRADQDCRARGYAAGTPERAQCVLQSMSAPQAEQPATVEPVSTPAAPPMRSFFTASNREIQGREQRACAAIGLNPAYGGFEACVKNLGDTFFAIDNPRN